MRDRAHMCVHPSSAAPPPHRWLLCLVSPFPPAAPHKLLQITTAIPRLVRGRSRW